MSDRTRPGAWDAVASARERVAAALETLPGPEDYEPAARTLRELATASPSLLAWLGEVPAFSAPLTASVGELRRAIDELDEALGLLATERSEATARVKFVVRS
jgi:hypothetical protein